MDQYLLGLSLNWNFWYRYIKIFFRYIDMYRYIVIPQEVELSDDKCCFSWCGYLDLWHVTHHMSSVHVLNLLYSFSLGDGLPFISICKYYARLKRQHVTLLWSLSKCFGFRYYIDTGEWCIDTVSYHFILICIDMCVSITVLLCHMSGDIHGHSFDMKSGANLESHPLQQSDGGKYYCIYNLIQIESCPANCAFFPG